MQFRCILCEGELFKVNLYEKNVFSKCGVFFIYKIV